MTVDPQFLASRPRRLLKWEEGPDGRVIVFRPRFGAGNWGSKVSHFLGLSDYRIRLDEIGSLVWKACDGDTEMARIATALRGEFGERVEPAEQLLHQFAVHLHRARMIGFQ